jgi:hypothetical protein
MNFHYKTIYKDGCTIIKALQDDLQGRMHDYKATTRQTTRTVAQLLKHIGVTPTLLPKHYK